MPIRKFIIPLFVCFCVSLIIALLLEWRFRFLTFNIFTPRIEKLAASEAQTFSPDEEKKREIIQQLKSHSQEEIVDSNQYSVPVFRYDVDGDGQIDRITSHDVRLTRRQYTYNIRGSNIRSVGFDDVDGDGYIDAWWFDPGDWYIAILWNKKGSGKFSGLQSFGINNPGESESMAAFLDLDGDGQLDIVYMDDREDLYWIKLVSPLRPLSSSSAPLR